MLAASPMAPGASSTDRYKGPRKVQPMTKLDEAYARITNDDLEQSYLITDPRKPDNPIVYANNAFLRLTGYDQNEVIGRNCRFLQGVGTDPETVAALRKAVSQHHEISAVILNYTKSGRPLWNHLQIKPSYSDTGELEYFIALQNEVAASEVQHKERMRSFA